MRAFQVEGRTINAYLAEPEYRSGAGASSCMPGGG